MNINGIRTDEQKYKAIEKVVSNRLFGIDRNLAVIQAIIDGDWEVEGEPLYYVKLVDSELGYLNITENKGLKLLSTKYVDASHKTQFTLDEVIEIDPRYLEFLEGVE